MCSAIYILYNVQYINSTLYVCYSGNEKHKLLVSDGTHFTTVLSVGNSINKLVCLDTTLQVERECLNTSSGTDGH